jgi:hypothetical protein
MREPLLFSGIRWPAARVIERRAIPGRQRSGWVGESGELQWQEALIVETTGNGHPYEIKHAEGWWRDLAELRIDDERRILSFLRRRGDPLGVLKPGSPIVTSEWDGLILRLRRASNAWKPLAGSQTFHVSAIQPDSYEAAKDFLAPLPDAWKQELAVEYQGLAPVLRARSLAAYCVAAAAASLRARLPMRRCDYCHSWFTLHYANARQCSASCRAARFNNRRSPHGFLQEDQDPQGSDPVAEPVAGAGIERPPAGPVAESRDQEGSGGARRADARDRKPRRRRPAPA